MALWNGSSSKSFDLPVRPWALTLLNPTWRITLPLEFTQKFTRTGSIRQIMFSGCIGVPRIDFLPHNRQYLNLNQRLANTATNTAYGRDRIVEITKALAALQPLYGKDNVEIITTDGRRVRGTVRSMKTTQALTTPSVKMEIANGQIVKIPFPTIAEIKDHNQ
jgi:hypothetical protein